MSKPIISMIAAIGRKRELGKDNKLLWHIPEDMQHFRRLTSGHAIVMGRKTFESLGRPLPNRTNIVVTRDPSYAALGCVVTSSVEGAIQKAKELEKEEIFIIGGAQIFEQAMKYADRLYLTVVDAEFDADTFFPDYSGFKKIISRKPSKDERYRYTFLELIK